MEMKNIPVVGGDSMGEKSPRRGRAPEGGEGRGDELRGPAFLLQK